MVLILLILDGDVALKVVWIATCRQKRLLEESVEGSDEGV